MQPAASSWSFEEDDLNAIVRTISRFLAETGARSSLLVDRSGQLVATVGEPLGFDPVTFATLTAADFSANDQLARLIGEIRSELFHYEVRATYDTPEVAESRRIVGEYQLSGDDLLQARTFPDAVGEALRRARPLLRGARWPAARSGR